MRVVNGRDTQDGWEKNKKTKVIKGEIDKGRK
jgi:hypothetical protein